VATVTKLVRNVFMAIIIPFMAFYYSRIALEQGEFAGTRTGVLKLLPLFIVGFLALAAIRSIGDAGINAGGTAFGVWESSAWKEIHGTVKGWAEVLMVVALAGVGLSTDLRSLKGLGVRPFMVGLIAALVVGIVSYVAISFLGSSIAL
jgi:uncharacterized membrane protein YadS